eukprot:TRINITY_DN483_c0_g1_i8.p2 TRINITY_DN483_c0_g1~~TRINITY_DN483_c0_g1_i8.p2  ORF type:complete len:109 (-),score=0.72 TRINITY_DN483_c0_g1_i8:11-337(-)
MQSTLESRESRPIRTSRRAHPCRKAASAPAAPVPPPSPAPDPEWRGGSFSFPFFNPQALGAGRSEGGAGGAAGRRLARGRQGGGGCLFFSSHAASGEGERVLMGCGLR